MEVSTQLYISAGVLGAVCLLLLVLVAVLFSQVSALRRDLGEMRNTGRIRVQKLKMDSDKNHAFSNPSIAPNEELSKRGYSMYVGSEADLESGRGTERQTGGQLLEDLTREIEIRQQRQSSPPPFLLQAIEENKRRSRINNPVATGGLQSNSNPNFIF